VKHKKTIIIMLFILVALSTSWQSALSIKSSTMNITTYKTFVFSTSYMHITNSDNKLIIEPGSVRAQIFSVIEQNPGIYFREICQVTGKEIGLVQYHLQVLMAFKSINQYQDGRYARFFVSNSTIFDEFGKLLVSAWNRHIDRKIISDLYTDKKRQSINQLAGSLGVSRQTISSHVNRLKDQGLLKFITIDGDACKYVALTEQAVAKLDALNIAGVLNCITYS